MLFKPRTCPHFRSHISARRYGSKIKCPQLIVDRRKTASSRTRTTTKDEDDSAWSFGSLAPPNSCPQSLARSQRYFHSVQESVVVKRFQEAIDGAVRQHSRSQSLGLMRGDKDNGYRMPRHLQLSLQVRPAHAIPPDAEDQTVCGV